MKYVKIHIKAETKQSYFKVISPKANPEKWEEIIEEGGWSSIQDFIDDFKIDPTKKNYFDVERTVSLDSSKLKKGKKITVFKVVRGRMYTEELQSFVLNKNVYVLSEDYQDI
jgi:hypothetical protein